MNGLFFFLNPLTREAFDGITIVMRFPLICTFLLLWAVPFYAHAYQCRYEPSPEEVLRDADAVFTGTVKAIVRQKPISKAKGGLGTPISGVTFAVNKVWKGLTSEDRLVPVLAEAFYGYDFDIGKEYLVYAYRIYTPDTVLSVVGCPRVRPVPEAQKALYRLGLPVLYPNLQQEKPIPLIEKQPNLQEEQTLDHSEPVAPNTEVKNKENSSSEPQPAVPASDTAMPVQAGNPEGELFETAPPAEPAL